MIGSTKGERSFHIFYELLATAAKNPELLASVSDVPLRACEDYVYLRRSGCCTVDKMDDVAEFQGMSAALTGLGVGVEAQALLWKCLIGLLELGNVEFADVGDASTTTKETTASVACAAQLLGVDKDALVILCFRNARLPDIAVWV